MVSRRTPPGVIVHPRALCESDAVGAGTQIAAFAYVMAGAAVGRDCAIGAHAFLETGATVGHRVVLRNGVMLWHGVSLADDVFVGPGAVFTNDRRPRSPRMETPPEVARRYAQVSTWIAPTTIGRGATLAAGAAIGAGITVGEYAFVEVGAVVLADVAPHAYVVGNPARREG